MKTSALSPTIVFNTPYLVLFLVARGGTSISASSESARLMEKRLPRTAFFCTFVCVFCCCCVCACGAEAWNCIFCYLEYYQDSVGSEIDKFVDDSKLYSFGDRHIRHVAVLAGLQSAFEVGGWVSSPA